MPRNNLKTSENKVLSRIYGKKRGWVFTPSHFLDLGSRAQVGMALKAICDRGIIRRISRGLYDYPKCHPKLGILEPTADQIVQAIATREHRKVQPSGAYAANLLGLSTQVPAKIVFLTDGPDKQLKVGNRTIQLKSRSPKSMAGAGTITGLFIQALRHLKQKNVTKQRINILKERLTAEQKKQLRNDIRLAPSWIADIIRVVSSEKPSD